MEFNNIMDWLRDDSKSTHYKFHDTFTQSCLKKMRRPVTDSAMRFKIQTDDYSYYACFHKNHGDCDFCVTAYDNSYLLPELNGQHELPEMCYSTLPFSDELILIFRNEKGYSKCVSSMFGLEANCLFVDTFNIIFGITKEQEKAMLAGSLLGWNSPAAKPWNYDQHGHLSIRQPRKNDPEQ
jgi:hypothetical protein